MRDPNPDRTDAGARGAAWPAPVHYNVAQDVCDKHPRRETALLWCHPGGDRRVTWGELQDDANRMARELNARGVRGGDRVAVLAPPSPSTAAAFLAILKAGAVVLPLPGGLAEEQVAFRLDDAEVALVVADAEWRDRVPRGFETLTPGVDEYDHHSPAPVTKVVGADEPAFILYTSGTTSDPKGVVFAHRTMLADSEFDYCADLRRGELTYWVGEWGWTLKKVFGPWRRGAVNVAYSYPGRLDVEEMLAVLSRHHVTNVFLNATLIKMMAREGDLGRMYPQSFRVVTTSNEPLGIEAFRWFEEQFGTPPLEFYGLTESYPMVGNSPRVTVRPGSMGRRVPGWDVAILDEEERPVAPGEEGEICLRARSNPHWPLGYWRKRAETERDFGGTWFHTKDLAHVDDTGYFWFHARRDDVIKASGYRIGPAEVERILVQHPSVREAAVVGVPDPVRGTAVKAFVSVNEGVDATAELERELRDLVKRAHSSFAAPRAVEFVPDFPRSATGKIRRSALRASSEEPRTDVGDAAPAERA
ncbi:MAG TPA: AMP-binding protein [Actinomycetota bacterium]|nr:AMP-binding protein [Actinomycetota bacterium]